MIDSFCDSIKEALTPVWELLDKADTFVEGSQSYPLRIWLWVAVAVGVIIIIVRIIAISQHKYQIKLDKVEKPWEEEKK